MVKQVKIGKTVIRLPWVVALTILGGLFLAWLFCLPRDLFGDVAYSTVVESSSGELMGARTASDGQWRFPPSAEPVPEKYRECLIEFEDRHFRYHLGVDPVAVARALFQNIKAGRVVSGASTISMQVIRMSRGKERSFGQKLVEAVLATRLEARYSKDEILSLYASHAPFGGNVVGIEAASWRYFSRPASELSWAEAATLAVLPNAPSLMHPGKNRSALLEKRNRLLSRLYRKGVISRDIYSLSCCEELPDKPQPLPQYARHLVDYYARTAPGRAVRSSIDLGLQIKVEAVADRWNSELSNQGIKDLAAVVIDIGTGAPVAYVGNANPASGRYGAEVDILRAPRSTGSILKPMLFAAALQDGDILPYTLLPDIPVNLNGFSPENFDHSFAGAVSASAALARSLNVPSVAMLREYGVPKFLSLLRNCGMTSLGRDADDYGLSLILGGAEGKLYDVARVYAGMAFHYMYGGAADCGWPGESWPLRDKCALWYTFDALKELNRPDEMDWKMVSSVRRVAWKTGTSFGFRDAWAVGVTPEYAVGVWAGNASGEGSAGLIGARTAGPVMFDIFSLLPRGGWFPEPSPSDCALAEVCRESGHLRGAYCEHIDTLMLPKAALNTDSCPYHRSVRVTEDESHRVSAAIPGSHLKTFFVLPPAMEWFYRKSHPEYQALPPFAPSSSSLNAASPMEFIYPESGADIFIPRRLDGSRAEVVFNLAHSKPETEVYWHLDSEYIGSTKYIHQRSFSLDDGTHCVTVVDAEGNICSVSFSSKNL